MYFVLVEPFKKQESIRKKYSLYWYGLHQPLSSKLKQLEERLRGWKGRKLTAGGGTKYLLYTFLFHFSN
jgi:hypothetical protein